MKKQVCAALACVFLLTACGKTDSDVTSETSAATSATETAVAEVTTTTQATTAKPTETTTEATEATTKPTTTEKLIETTTEPPPQTTTTAKPTETTTQATTTEKQTEKEEKVEMPEIVFIVLSNQFSSENVVYGYFINNKGEIRYYEYMDERYEAYTPPPNENEWGMNYMERFRKWKFSYDLIDEMYDTIIETSVDTGERVEEEKLNELYEQLLSADTSKGYEDDLDEAGLDIDFMAKHSYGIKLSPSKTNEKILLRAGGEVFYLSYDDKINALFEEISSLFPTLDLYYIPQILQTEDNKEDE